MNDDEESLNLLIEDEDDPLTDASDTADPLSLKDVDRRVDRAKDERAVEDEPLQTVADDVARQRFDVNDDVGQFWQDERLTTHDE